MPVFRSDAVLASLKLDFERDLDFEAFKFCVFGLSCLLDIVPVKAYCLIGSLEPRCLDELGGNLFPGFRGLFWRKLFSRVLTWFAGLILSLKLSFLRCF